jgi:DNA repair protein RadD
MSNYKLRDYQERVLQELFSWFKNNPTGNPIVSACVGAGKSILIAEFCKRVIEAYPDQRILMAVASRELVAQNYEKLRSIYPEGNMGLYSAGLGKKNPHAKIVFATIGSVYDKAMQTGAFNICLVDEAHNVSRKETGMYRQMIADYTRLNPKFRVIGFTGTPYRGDGILLTEGDQALFTDIASKITMRKLLDEGYLSPLVTHKVETRIATNDVGVSRMTGDYNISELSDAVDRIEVTRSAVKEIITAGHDRKSWLIYGVTIEHCEHIHEELEKNGIHGAMVHGKTPKAQRDRILADFKAHRIRYVVNVLCLTVGFDHPATDLIALLRPTKSKVLYVQISGRGLRTHPEKENCLWLDFSSTTESLGEVDMVKGRHQPPPGTAPTKVCGGKDKWEEGCSETVPASTAFCPYCGFDFEMPEPDKFKDLRKQASSADVISKPVEPTRLSVATWTCKSHAKLGSQTSMQVSYFGENNAPVGNLTPVTAHSHREWVCFDHDGYARRKAETWWQKMGGKMPYPADVKDAIERFSELTKPNEIQLKKEGKYYVITNHYFPIKELNGDTLYDELITGFKELTEASQVHNTVTESASDTFSAETARPSVSSAFSRALSPV